MTQMLVDGDLQKLRPAGDLERLPPGLFRRVHAKHHTSPTDQSWLLQLRAGTPEGVTQPSAEISSLLVDVVTQPLHCPEFSRPLWTHPPSYSVLGGVASS
jgi:hypothetical protein